MKDDKYEGASNYDNWTHSDGTARIDWTWGAGRADGGAYAGLGEEFAVTIDPAFNEDAALYGEHYDGTVEHWEALSGNRTDPRRTRLSRSEPVVVAAGGCDDHGGVTVTADGGKRPKRGPIPRPPGQAGIGGEGRTGATIGDRQPDCRAGTGNRD